VALLLHAEAGESRYRVEVPSADNNATESKRDRKLAYHLDRFFVIKK